MTVSEAVLIIREKMFERKIYSHCENEIKVGERILNIRREKHMICNNCGREIRDDSKFCAVCGAEVTHNQADVQKPVPGKTNRYVVLIGIISLLIAVIMGVVVWLLISMNNDDKQELDIYESDNSDSLTGGLKSASKDVLADDKKDDSTQEEGLEDESNRDVEYIIPDAYYETPVCYGEETYDTIYAFLDAKGVTNRTPFFIWGKDKNTPDCIIYYDEEEGKGCLVRLQYQDSSFSNDIIGYTLTYKGETDWCVDIEEDTFSPLFIDTKTGVKEDFPEAKEEYKYDDDGKITEYLATDVLSGYEDDGEQMLLNIIWTYREDGTLEEREYHHNPLAVCTSQATLFSYYDEKGRVVHENYYMTHGSHDTYTIYFTDRTDSYFVDIDPWCGNDLEIYHTSNGNEVLNEAEVLTEYNDNLTFDEKIKIIKDNYYEIQANLDQYRKSGDVEGLVCYHDKDQIKKIIAAASVYSETKDLFAGYKAEYYYLDEKVNFVFVYGNSEEYRFYLDINQSDSCIRYIGPDGVVQDFENGKIPTDVNELGIFCNFAQMEVNVTRGLGEE